MNNGDKPINPVRGATGVPFDTNDGHEKHIMESCMVGLTKREYFAGLAMQGLLASYAGLNSNPEPLSVANKSIQYADELLKQLEK